MKPTLTPSARAPVDALVVTGEVGDDQREESAHRHQHSRFRAADVLLPPADQKERDRAVEAADDDYHAPFVPTPGESLPYRQGDDCQHQGAERYPPAGNAYGSEIVECDRDENKGAAPDGADKEQPGDIEETGAAYGRQHGRIRRYRLAGECNRTLVDATVILSSHRWLGGSSFPAPRSTQEERAIQRT